MFGYTVRNGREETPGLDEDLHGNRFRPAESPTTVYTDRWT
jgi:hypothetical protein